MHSSHRALATLALASAVAAGPASAGAKHHPSLTIKAQANGKLGEQILVTASGRTLYRLRPETARHWLCTSRACRQIWRPLLVGSSMTTLKRGAGVSGSLKLVTRPDGRRQVAFHGFPLYTYAGDSRAGQASGQNIRSFGGTWLVLRTGPLGTPMPMPSPSTPYTTMTPPPTQTTTPSPMPTPYPSPSPAPTPTPSPTPDPGPYNP